MSTKITAPVATEGEVTSYFGPHTVVFKDGVATVDFEINDGLKAYLLSTGYGLGGTKAKEPDAPAEPADPRDVDHVLVGTDLRDAAVDPRDEDFLAPTNAGEANPHGPDVVSPGIHAVAGPGPIVPGTVGSKEYQEAKESVAAEAVLAGDVPVPEATAKFGDLAAAEYSRTKADGPHAGLAQEVSSADLTDEERDLLGLSDSETPDHELKGEALDAKLDELGLSKDGTADEKRARVRVAGTAPEDLKGADLETALREAGLALTGSADERRARVQEYRDAQGA